MAIDFSSIDSIIGGFDKVLSLSSIGGPPPVPTPLILIGVPQRAGLSPTKIASKIIARKSEAGLPVGVLPSGGVNPDEIMERIRIEEIVKAFQEDAIITVAIPPDNTHSSRYFTSRTRFCIWFNNHYIKSIWSYTIKYEKN